LGTKDLKTKGPVPGAGLVVTYVAPDSPAVKAGLEKNDVLVELDDQLLVVSAQLRKLVQVRKEGDTVKLAYYRAGKKHTTTATLGKTSAGFGFLNDERSWGGDLKELQLQLRDLPLRDTMREQMEVLRKSLGNMKIDRKKMQEEIAQIAWENRIPVVGPNCMGIVNTSSNLNTLMTRNLPTKGNISMVRWPSANAAR
jgi:membrane-associated protease RseP (regulator of RpoE activity)